MHARERPVLEAHEMRSGAGVLHDRALPQLLLLRAPGALAARLRPLVHGGGALRIRVLKHTAGKRCVLGAEFEGGERAVLKLYRKQRARQHAAHLQVLGEALRGGTRTPRLVACWEDWGTVVQEWVPGEAAPEYADLGGREDVLARLGIALGELHGLELRLGPRADFDAHLRRTCHPGLAALAHSSPGLGSDLQRLENEMRARAARTSGEVRTCHGDFGPRQVFVHGPTVYLVDVDGMCTGAPAFDVAAFRVGLQAHLGAQAESAARGFLEAYLRQRGIDIVPELDLWEAFTWVRRAMILWRKRPPNAEEQWAACVQRAQAVLELP